MIAWITVQVVTEIFENEIVGLILKKVLTTSILQLLLLNISKCIDKLKITDQLRNQYEFKLIFRGSRDGSYPENFHKICDNKSQTVTIAKVKDCNEILGGYNPIEWKSDRSWGITKDSFIFSFKNNDKIEDFILSHVMNDEKATYNAFNYGPTFGADDLYIWIWGACYSKKSSYKLPIRESQDYFDVEECEVFQVIKH